MRTVALQPIGKSEQPGTYKNSHEYFILHREWKRAWKQVNDIHDEIAKQVGTRIVAACEQEGVQVIRLEDLSWAKHSAKKDVGLFLATLELTRMRRVMIRQDEISDPIIIELNDDPSDVIVVETDAINRYMREVDAPEPAIDAPAPPEG